MKKYIIIIFLLTFSHTFSQLTRIWEKSAAQNNLPSWFSTSENSETGIAYGRINNRLYVVSNKGGESNIIILNAATGDSIGKLNTTGISGGDLLLYDVETDFGEVIYASNYTTNPSLNPFKIYKWNSETSFPEVFITNNSLPGEAGRFTITHHTGMPMLTYTSKNNNQIVIYNFWDNSTNFKNLPLTITGNNASVSHAFGDDINSSFYFLINSDNNKLRHFSSYNPLNYKDSIVSINSNAVKYYSNGTLCCNFPFFIAFQYGEGKENLIFKRGNIYEESPSLGNNPNPFNRGDVDYNVFVQWGTRVIVYVLSANNGIGAYYSNLVTPVELTSFNAKIINNKIELNWETATETNNMGFEIQKLEVGIQNTSTTLSTVSEWKVVGFVEGNGTTTESKKYSFIDVSVKEGNNYKYRLKQIDYDGSFEFSNEIEIEFSIPKEFSLSQNYPNPFNPVTEIRYQISEDSKVAVKVFDILGKEITTLVNEFQVAGSYQIEFNSNEINLSNGIYFYQLQAGSFISTKKMILMK